MDTNGSFLDRAAYAVRYGPTTGDRIRLADSDLVATIERDVAYYGDELVNGWGKTARPRQGFTTRETHPSELDFIITNVVVMDPILGIFKADIGVKDGLIVGTGRSGNPDITDGIELVVGPNTVPLPGRGLIATPGGVDTHVHLRSPKLIPAALAAGMTTLITGGLEENPSFNLHRTLEAFEQFPVNLGLLGRVSSDKHGSLIQQVEAGVCGFKVHEDFAASPSYIDAALAVAEVSDVAVALHTDGMNEACEYEETVAAIGGRTIHAYHVEGVGGGHTPDIIRIAGLENVIGSSTTPTIPYGQNAVAEHRAMMWAVHGMNPLVVSDRTKVNPRIRQSTMFAESWLQDLGAISIINSDSQGMGRIAEVIRRTWQLAHVMKQANGAENENDNARILQYIAKYTINAARTHGVDRWVGSLETGKLADIVLWDPRFFGVKPDYVMKGGFPAWGAIGEGNATVQMSEPVIYGPRWGGQGNAAASISLNFVSGAASPSALRQIQSRRRAVAVEGTRRVTKANMEYNSESPDIRVDSDSGEVSVDGQPLTALDVHHELPLNRLYLLL